jgi:hypothetical protein
MNTAEALTALNAELLQTLVPQVLDVLTCALREGTAVHQVEADLWDLALQLGRRSLAAFFATCGTGDLGESLTLPDGHEVQRLARLHPRRYVSIFGEFRLERTAYGSREGQAIEFVPWTTACNCPRASSPTCCKTGTRRWRWSRRLAR